MSEQDSTQLLTEIRDLSRQQVELAQLSVKNQALALENQQKAISIRGGAGEIKKKRRGF